MSELREMLLSRGYRRNLIDDNIEKALLVPRDEAIKRKVRKKEMDRVVFSVMYHPALPSIPRLIAKGYRAMVESDPRLKEVFKKPPMVASRRPPSLWEKLRVLELGRSPSARHRETSEGEVFWVLGRILIFGHCTGLYRLYSYQYQEIILENSKYSENSQY